MSNGGNFETTKLEAKERFKRKTPENFSGVFLKDFRWLGLCLALALACAAAAVNCS